MAKEIYISSTPHETRLAIVENEALAEIYYERENEYTLAGSIYNGKVTRVLPGMQSSFVDIGLERDAFLYITDFMEEAGDSADFDSGDRQGGQRRGRPQGERRTEAGDDSTGEAQLEGSSAEPRGERRGRRDRNRRDQATSEPQQVHQRAEEPEAVAAEPYGDSEEPLGEGAPGADTLRRWRGRRGRRRGRGAATDAGAAEAAPQQMVSFAPEEEQTSDEGMDLYAASEPTYTEEPRSSRDGGGMSRREQRDRNRGQRQEFGSTDEPQEESRARGRERRPDRRSAESDGVADTAGGLPAMLPGESLAKYDGRASEAPSANVIAPTPAPSTEYTLRGQWDGGATLPGESLARHRGRRSDETERAPRGRASRSRSRSHDSQFIAQAPETDPGHLLPPVSEAEADGNTADFGSAVATAATVIDSPEAPELEAGQVQPAPLKEEFLGLAGTLLDAAAAVAYEDREPVAAPVDPQVASTEAEVPAATMTSSEPAEYEPGDEDSVSLRAESTGRAEFRQSPPSGDSDPAVEEVTPEFTAIQPTGEMLSEPEAQGEHVFSSPTAPIEHEEAVQSVSFEEAEVNATPMIADVPASDSNTWAADEAEERGKSHLFEPGDGELEEELMDDDDVLPVMEASAAEPELEAVEGAAFLGDVLRELSIEQRTGFIQAPSDEEDEYADGEIDELEMARTDDDLYEEDESAEAAAEQEEAAEEFADDAVGQGEAAGEERRSESRDGVRRGDRRSGRREERRDRRPGGGGGGHRNGGRMSRAQAQTSDLPAISDLLKPGQEVLVQIAKEPIAKKGARITSHIALPGRFLVFMPTVSHVGVSRKIESDGERRRLKEILLSERGDASGGFIVRTAASGASEEELRSDLRFLLNLWADIKSRSESSKSPALIYHDLNLIERILRDQVTDQFSAIWVDTETEYERVLRFLQRFQPALIRRVKLYTKDTPLFEQFGITEEINKALRSKVWLKSGGSIVINQTEALVAIDINTGKYVGKTARLEDTIVKTNLDAIPEIVRQIRLRDLGGIIIIDFIDMDERKNRAKVMAALEEELKSDRAPSKVLQFNDFGLVAITRKRVKQSLERTLSTTCNICAGTGMVKSPVTVANDIYVEMRKMQKHLDRNDVMLRVNPEVVKQLKAPGTKWLQEMEEMVGKTILVKSDPSLHPEQFDIH